jgi:hypothetical protein
LLEASLRAILASATEFISFVTLGRGAHGPEETAPPSHQAAARRQHLPIHQAAGRRILAATIRSSLRGIPRPLACSVLWFGAGRREKPVFKLTAKTSEENNG